MSSNKKKNNKNTAGKPFDAVIENAKNVRDAAFSAVTSAIDAILEKKESEAVDEPVAEEPKVKEKEKDFYKKQARGVRDTLIPTAEQRFVYGKRSVEEVSNSSLFLTRFGYKHAFANKGITCDEYHDAETGALVGIVPRISLDTVWTKAKKWIALGKGTMPAISELEWENAKNKLVRYIKRNDKSKEAIVRNVMVIPELAFRELYISRASAAITLIDYAVKYEIYETDELRRKWSKIKKYKHKVSLLAANGGIFTAEEVNVLRSLNINYLNDIRKQSIFVLKHYLFNHDFSEIVKQINEAFKEDLERRRDKRYKVYPFLIGYTALAVMTIVGYVFKYDLIKDAEDKAIFANVASVAWILGLLVMLRGVVRARRRRRTKRPDYRYFTVKVKRATRFLTVFSIFSICSLLIFFQRYDGYNSTLYYRDLKDGTVAIAGLRDEEMNNISIPEKMDEKTVSEIDILAFRNDRILSVSLSENVRKIDTNAFRGCDSLSDIYNSEVVSEIGRKAFNGCTSLEKILFGELSSVGKSAFNGCSALTTVEFSMPIEQIPDGMFRDCTSIVTATSFENVKVVGKNAFRGCTSLSDLDLSNVVTIGAKAFYGCSSLRTVNVTATTESIGKDAFTGCNGVTKITVPFIGPDRENAKNKSFSYVMSLDGIFASEGLTVEITDITSVHAKAFKKCSFIGSIILPDTVTVIEGGAFNGAGSLVSVNIPSGVTNLPEELFSGCTELTTIIGGEGVETIEKNAFSGCTSLTEISFPKVKIIGERAFYGCSSLTSLGEHAELTSVGKAAFRDCTSITAVSIPTVNSLGELAFAGCTALKTVELSGQIGKIPNELFLGDYNLVNFSIPAGITEIGDAAFKSTGITNIIWNDEVTVIGKEAFEYTSIVDLKIPASVTNIGKNAFADSSIKTLEAPFIGESADSTKNGFKHVFGAYPHLTDVTLTGTKVIGKKSLASLKYTIVNLTLAEGTEKIEKKAFKGFTNLAAVTLPSTLTEIGDQAFYGCGSLSSVNLEDTSLTKCGKSVFEACTSFVSITVPGSLKTVPERFAADNYAKSVTFEEGIEKIDKKAFTGSGIENIVLPDTVKSIGEDAFSNCAGVKSITLSEGLEGIGKRAFASLGFGITEVTIPGSVNTIGESAFEGCLSLETINIEDGVKKIEKSAFARCIEIEKMVIPDSVEFIDKNILSGCSGLTTLVTPFVGKTTSETKKLSYMTDSFYLSVLEITSAQFVGKKALASGSMLTTVTFGEGVKTIEPGICEGLYNINRVNLPESLKDCADYFPVGTVYIDGELYTPEISDGAEDEGSDEPVELKPSVFE